MQFTKRVNPLSYMHYKDVPYLYCVFSEHGLTACTTMNTCWKWLRICLGLKGGAPGSWKIMVTISLPMCRFRRSCLRLFGVKGRSVDTWNITSRSRYWVYTLYRPVESAKGKQKINPLIFAMS